MLGGALTEKVWKRFVQEGVLDSSRLNKRIAESWFRCRQAGVNPFSGEGRSILTKDSLESRRQAQKELYELAVPYLEKLYAHIKETSSLVLFIDPEGYVLYMKGDRNALEHARNIHFVEGVKWTEEEVGTNAIGTALSVKEPMMVVGSEHYSVASQRWACMAAPIRDEEGGLLGIIDVSCLLEHAHAHTMGAVVSTAYAIEHMRKIQEREDEIELMRHSFRFLESQDPVLICDRKSRIVAVSRSLREALPPTSSLRSVEEITHYGFGILLRCPIYSSLHHRPIGECIHLQTVKNKEKRHVSLGSSFDFPGEKGVSGVFQNLLQEVERLARSDVTVHIFGESGTGKEVIARALHRNSSRKDRPFIAVNCGAIPQELMASELFGYVEGAFTGARKHGSKGKFLEADGGTIFLDEIGEIPYSMQVALLRVIQEREVIPLGSARPVPVDVRIITATNRDLKELVQEGKFREDLFYRLYVYPLCLPPLRKRKEDLPYLISYYCRKNRWNVTFPPDVAAKLMEYDWPGNVRELFNFLDRMRIVCGDRSPHISDVLMIFETHSVPRFVLSSSEPPLTYREQVQKQQMMQALQKAQGNVRQAAQLLNMPRSTFYRKMKKFRLS